MKRLNPLRPLPYGKPLLEWSLLVTVLCPMCSMGLSSSCLGGSCGQTELAQEETHSFLLGIPSPTPLKTEGTDDAECEDSNRSGRSSNSRRQRSNSDSQSAGRKEAAKLYPLNSEEPCEWSGSANVGGGSYPILGCPLGVKSIQQSRHHGPDKHVSNNESGNVHRICHYCHYRWHAANDKTYDWNAGIWPPHEPRPLTKEEQQNQILDYMRYLATTKRGNKKKELVD